MTLKERRHAGAGVGNTVFVKPAEMRKDETIEGWFVETYENNFGGWNHKIRTKLGDVSINGTTQLNGKMEGLAAGTWIVITYLGMERFKSGKNPGKPTHQFSVKEDVEGELGNGPMPDAPSEEVPF